MTVKASRVVLAIPTLKGNHKTPQWIDCMANLQGSLGSSMGRLWIEDAPIAEARNDLCRAALRTDADYIVFLGDDVLPPGNMILLMLDKIGRSFPTPEGVARASMITGVYWTKTIPPEPYLWNGLLEGSYKDWTAGEFFPVDMAGCDALMIETAMLREIPEPWFETNWTYEAGQKPSSIATEDFYFYAKTRAAGYRLFADTGIQCFHEDRYTGQAFGLTMDMRQAGGTPETPDDEALLIAEVGAGTWSPAWGSAAKVVRFDMRDEAHPEVRCDIRHIPEQYMGIFDIAHASHVLEHFRREEAPELVKHWAGLLKPGGKLIIRVPNVLAPMRRIIAAEEGRGHADAYDFAQLWGDQARAGAPWEHLNGFTPKTLVNLLKMHGGFANIDTEETEEGLNLKVTATLERAIVPEAIAPMWDAVREREIPLAQYLREGIEDAREKLAAEVERERVPAATTPDWQTSTTEPEPSPEPEPEIVPAWHWKPADPTQVTNGRAPAVEALGMVES